MGIWVELGIFGLALAFGIWQIRDVARERAKREAAQAREPEHERGQERAAKAATGQTPQDGSDH